MKIYLAGTPANHRELTLINAGVHHRLVTYAVISDVKHVLKKWGFTVSCQTKIGKGKDNSVSRP